MTTELKQLAENYDFALPKELIAQFPLANRVDAKLMVVHRDSGAIEHRHVRDLAEILVAGDCLVQNDSKVIPARLNGYRTRTGGRWSGLFLEQDTAGLWRFLGKTKGKLQVGETVELIDNEGRKGCELKLLTKLDGGSWVGKCSLDLPAFEVLERVGAVPLPHYIRGGNMVEADIERYQTVYATERGSIAAPTAGLHFNSALIHSLREHGVEMARVTLHVGIGTFRPISSEDLESHQMHSEVGSVSLQTAQQINAARENGGRVIAVGTTSVRVLESAMSDSGLEPWSDATNLFIKPPYQFRAIQGLMTNFHLPRSTLLVLVRTFGGDELIRRAYEIAVAERYRFFSYGDAMLIL